MADIVTRLRDADISGHGKYSALVREAATEIERLRADIVSLRAEMYGEVASRDAKIEQLTAVLDAKDHPAAGWPA